MNNDINDAPNYREAFSNTNALKAAMAIGKSGGVANFSTIQKGSGVKPSTLEHKYLTPLCYIFSEKPLPVVYLGLLGRKG